MIEGDKVPATPSQIHIEITSKCNLACGFCPVHRLERGEQLTRDEVFSVIRQIADLKPEMLRRAIESLRMQLDPDWEHLIYDDGSTNPRIDDVLRWAAEDSRVRIWRGEKNRDRPALAWNFLLDRSAGRYLTTLDDDDEKLPSFVAAMSAELDADPSIDLVTCGFIVRSADGGDWEHHHNLKTTPEGVEMASTCGAGMLAYRREAFTCVGHFSEAIRTNEDWEWMRRAVKVLRIKNLPDCHVVYHQHTGNRQWRAAELGHKADVETIRRTT